MAYAMSVIMSRALPDARDGLKPVHRRILYAMHKLNLQPDGPHRKCARVVGEVLGKYHPHGDSSVYEALVRMAQPFSLRAPLIDGHGNFGSIDPDPPAAMRYTECRLAKLARDSLLADVEQDTVDFADNFDGSEEEPTVLPAKLPMLLLNGATGIAVGMATNCPPHNLGELVDALQVILKDPEVSDEKLFSIIPAPDFPSGGTIMGLSGARQMYSTGRGSVVVRAKAHTEMLPTSRGQGRPAIVVTELPYTVAKNGLLEKVASLVNEKKLAGIAEIRDESSMEGLRIVFEVRRDADPLMVLNHLYKRTELQRNFAGNLMAVLGEGRMPQQMTLRQALQSFLDFRVECVKRRSAFQLRKAEAKLHIVEGMLQAQGSLDEVIGAIRSANSTAEAQALLTSSAFGLSQLQADAILSMQLRRLTKLERASLIKEEAELSTMVAHLSSLLADKLKVDTLISEELAELRQNYATPRLTEIEHEYEELSDMDLTAQEQVIIVQSAKGFVKRMPLDEFEEQGRGTRGKAGMANLGDGDAVIRIFTCMSHDTILCISEKGIAYALHAFQVPQATRTARGVLLHQLLPLDQDEAIASLLPVSEFSDSSFLVLLTSDGWIKKTALRAFDKITARGLTAASLADGDRVVHAALCTDADSAILVSKKGLALRFNTDSKQLRASGRASRGVKSIALRDGDSIADMDIIRAADAATDALTSAATTDSESGESDGGDEADDDRHMLVAVTREGFGKRMDVDNFAPKGRGGRGMIAIKFKRETDRLLTLSQAQRSDQLLLITQKGTIVRQSVSAISAQGRAATGVQLQRLDDDDFVASVAIVPPVEEEEPAAEA